MSEFDLAFKLIIMGAGLLYIVKNLLKAYIAYGEVVE